MSYLRNSADRRKRIIYGSWKYCNTGLVSAGSVLPHGEKVPLWYWLTTLLVMVSPSKTNYLSWTVRFHWIVNLGVTYSTQDRRYVVVDHTTHYDTAASAGKNTGKVFVTCRAWKCVPTTISGSVHISEVPSCHLLQQMSSQWGSKNYFKDRCLMNSKPNFLILTYF